MTTQDQVSRNLRAYVETIVNTVMSVQKRVNSILSDDGKTITVSNINANIVDVDDIALNNKINGIDIMSSGPINMIEDFKDSSILSGGTVYHDASFDSVNNYVVLTNELASSTGQLEYNINPGAIWTADFEFQYVDIGGAGPGGAIFMYMYNTSSVSGVANLTQVNNLGGFVIAIEPVAGTIRIRNSGAELTNTTIPALAAATWHNVKIVCEGGRNYHVYINNVNHLNFRAVGVFSLTGAWAGFAAYLTAFTDAEYRIRNIKIHNSASYITNSMSNLGELNMMPLSYMSIGTLKAGNFEENAAALSMRINSTGKLGQSSFLAGYGSGGSVIDGGATIDVTYIGSEVAISATGSSNTAVGARAMYSSTSANFNTALGASALYSNTTGQYNTAVGTRALFSNISGSNSVAVGDNALHDNTSSDNNAFGNGSLFTNTSGSDNCAYGTTSLYLNTTGSNNTAFGNLSLYSNIVGNYNNAVGVCGLYSNTTGNHNNAFGFQSLRGNTTGTGNNAFGHESMFLNTTGNDNSAVGYRSLFNNTTGTGNNAFGYQSLFSNETGSYNIAFGYKALFSNTNGNFNNAHGTSSLYSNTEGNFNNAHGTASLHSNTTGESNNAFGHQSLYSNTTGNFNTASGFMSLYSNVTGGYNNAFGHQSLYSNTTGNFNTASGFSSLYSNVTGGYNNAFGYRSLAFNNESYNNAFGGDALFTNTTGTGNNAFGYQSLYLNETGSHNSAFGHRSLYANKGGSNNAFGYNALFSNTNGNFNNAHGTLSLYSNTTGGSNNAFGHQSLFSNISGSGNIAIGNLSGGQSVTGNNNIFIGQSSRVNVDGHSNSIAIGYDTMITDSNQCIIGNGITALYTMPSNTCTLGGPFNLWSDIYAFSGVINTSDATQKNISSTMNFGLNELLQLKPIAYTWKNTEAQTFKRTHYGFAAQDIGKLIEDGIIEDSGIYIKSPLNDGGYVYGLRLSELIAPIVRSVQELHERLVIVESRP